MTKKTLDLLIKKAAGKKETALDKAMSTAAKLGKPTTSGLVAGTGLGAILAAAGALSREGDEPGESSVLSNPLLLGTIGATGGYLAGNAFERAPVDKPKSNGSISNLSKLLAAGGVGTFGTMLAKQDILDKLEAATSKYNSELSKLPLLARNTVDELGRTKVDFSRLAKPTSEAELASFKAMAEQFGKARKEYANALRDAGRIDDAVFHGMPKSPDGLKLRAKIIEKLRFSPYSPFRWGKALTPAKGKLVLSLIKRTARSNPKLTTLAALTALAGGGKAVYDKVKE